MNRTYKSSSSFRFAFSNDISPYHIIKRIIFLFHSLLLQQKEHRARDDVLRVKKQPYNFTFVTHVLNLTSRVRRKIVPSKDGAEEFFVSHI